MTERKHQHLLTVAMALFFQSRVAIQFWGECILTVAFLINRTPASFLKNQSPYQFLYHSLVDYSSFRVFSCLCFASTLPSYRSKFSPRATACVFLGYPPGVKGYKLYDIAAKKFLISRDIVFHEGVFPFHAIVSSHEVVDHFLDLVMPQPNLDVPSPTLIASGSTSLLEPLTNYVPGTNVSKPSFRRSTRVTRPPLIFKIFIVIC